MGEKIILQEAQLYNFIFLFQHVTVLAIFLIYFAKPSGAQVQNECLP